MSSLKKAGIELCEGTFTLDELVSNDAALFVSSTPIDILPVTYVEDKVFNSVSNPILTQISREYRSITEQYIMSNK